MPYIKEEIREHLAHKPFTSQTPGELNYVIHKLLQAYITNKGTSYHTYNDIIGVLECVKQEVYRRVVVPYEEFMLQENGDVW